MKTTKNKIIKGIKTLSKAPLYCAIFVSGGLGCIRQEAIPTTKDTRNNDQDQIIDEETDQNILDEEMGQDNHGYKNSSTSSSTSTDDNSHVDKNNNNLDENNNVVETPNNAEKVLCTEQPICTKQPKKVNILQATPEKNNKASKEPNSAGNKTTKSSTNNESDQQKQSINKPLNPTSSSPKKHGTDSKKVVDPNPKFNYQLPKNTKDENEDIEKPKQYTLEDLNKLIPTLRNLYNKVKKIKNKNENTEKLLNNVKPFLKSVSDIQKDNQECICNAVKLVNGYITALKNE